MTQQGITAEELKMLLGTGEPEQNQQNRFGDLFVLPRARMHKRKKRWYFLYLL